MNISHCLGRISNVFSIFSNPHQGAVSVFFPFIAAAQCGSHPPLVAVDCLGAGVPKIKAGSSGRIGSCFKPLPKPFHDIMGVKISRLNNAFGQAKGHAAVIRPKSNPLSMDTVTRHPGNGIFSQIFSGTAFCRHSQRICHT